jgi:hypothetical protein
MNGHHAKEHRAALGTVGARCCAGASASPRKATLYCGIVVALATPNNERVDISTPSETSHAAEQPRAGTGRGRHGSPGRTRLPIAHTLRLLQTATNAKDDQLNETLH